MKRAIIAPAEIGGAALDELKSWLAITVSGDDETLKGLLRSSMDVCEGFTGTMPLSANCEEIMPAHCQWQSLSTRPVQAITTVAGIDADNARYVLASSDYRIDIAADGSGKIRLINPGSARRIAVGFVAGMAPGWGSLPDGLKRGIIRLAAHYFEERGAGAKDGPPASVSALWRPWRRLRLA